VLYTTQGRAAEATALLQAATQAAPGYAEAWNNLGVVQRDIGAVTDAIHSYERAATLAPDQPNAAQNRLLALNYARHGEDAWVCEQHAAWGRSYQSHIQPLPPVTPTGRTRQLHGGAGSDGGAAATSSGSHNSSSTAPPAAAAVLRPLRVGYVSPDLFTHSVSYFAEAPLSHHNAAAVSVVVYDSTPRRDVKSRRLRQQTEAAGGVWKCVEAVSDEQLAALVRDDCIDVLVELTGVYQGLWGLEGNATGC